MSNAVPREIIFSRVAPSDHLSGQEQTTGFPPSITTSHFVNQVLPVASVPNHAMSTSFTALKSDATTPETGTFRVSQSAATSGTMGGVSAHVAGLIHREIGSRTPREFELAHEELVRCAAHFEGVFVALILDDTVPPDVRGVAARALAFVILNAQQQSESRTRRVTRKQRVGYGASQRSLFLTPSSKPDALERLARSPKALVRLGVLEGASDAGDASIPVAFAFDHHPAVRRRAIDILTGASDVDE